MSGPLLCLLWAAAAIAAAGMVIGANEALNGTDLPPLLKGWVWAVAALTGPVAALAAFIFWNAAVALGNGRYKFRLW